MLRLTNTKEETHFYLLLTIIGSIVSAASSVGLIILSLYALFNKDNKEEVEDHDE